MQAHARAFERQPRNWIDSRLREGTPMAGMARFIEAATPADQAFGIERVHKAIADGRLDWVQSPNDRPHGDARAARATTHGGFDDDPATLAALVANVLGKRRSGARVGLHATPRARAQRRARFVDGVAGET